MLRTPPAGYFRPVQEDLWFKAVKMWRDWNLVPDRGPSIKHVRKILRKTNISNPLIRTRPNAHQGVRNVSPSENFAYVLNRWSLEEKGVLCGLSRMTNTLQQSNNPKVLSSKTRIRFRTDAVRDHFNKIRSVQPSMVMQFRWRK